MSGSAVHIALTVLFCAGLVLAAPCPDKIQYQNGNSLKRGDTFYHPTGQYLLRDASRVYYSNGNYFLNNGNYYYENGNYLVRDDKIYHPNGNYLKKGDDYYWSNGNALFRSNNFYYSNGTYARRNGKLYRPDGSETPFPVILEEGIGNVGFVYAEARADSQTIELSFQSLMSAKNGVSLRALWENTTFTRIRAEISTGYPNEFVVVHLAQGSIQCEWVGGEILPPKDFELFSLAADVHVRVHPGYDPQRVRQTLIDALKKLESPISER